MTSSLGNIKSKYALKNIFDYIAYSFRLKLLSGSKKLLNNLDITIDTFKKFYEIKKVIDPSFNVEKYINYVNLGTDDDNEKFIYGILNTVKTNVSFFVENEKWLKIVKHINNIKLMITPNLLNYICDLNNENKTNIFHLLNLYKNNIVEISFSDFSNTNKIKFDTINQIINILEKIFRPKINDKNNNNNEYHNIKKISFEANEILPYIDITGKFLDKINEIISLNLINELFIDACSFNELQFSNIMKYIPKKLISLKSLIIINFGYKKSHYADLSFLLTSPNTCIDNIDLSHSLMTCDILPILNTTNFPLKNLKLKLSSNENEINWLFLEYNRNTLELFEIEIIEKNNHDNMDKIISILNKMAKLKHLKIIGDLSPSELFKFNNINNIEYLNIEIDLLYDKVEVFPTDLNCYFSNYANLKSLILKSKDTFKISNDKYKAFGFIFPPKLKYINLINFDDTIIIPLLEKNKKNLAFLEEFKLENCHFTHEQFSILVDLFSGFKNLLKLSLNKIDYKSSYRSIMEDILFYDYIPSILQNVPSLIELDISNNKYDDKILKSKIFKEIAKSIPKKLFSLNIFNSEIQVTSKAFDYLIKLFGPLLYFDNNYPIINDKLIMSNDNNDDLPFYDNYNSDYSDYEIDGN